MMHTMKALRNFAAGGALVTALLGCQPKTEQAVSSNSQEPTIASAPMAETLEPHVVAKTSVPAIPLVPAEIEPTVPDVTSDPASQAPMASLTIGSPAPPLAIAKWMKGEPIGGFEAGQVYVVEFWATWCGPCRTSMPHMSSVQESYGDEVQIVGITRENEAIVSKFLEKEQSAGKLWSDVIKYRLALDAGDATNSAYMKAAQQSGIPTAFIVGKDGIIEWIGHPMSMDQPLSQVIDGSWQRAAMLAEFNAQQRLRALSRELSTLQRSRDWEAALKLVDELEQEVGESAALLKMKLSLLTSAGRSDDAKLLRSQIVDLSWDNAMQLNELAWNIAIGKEKSQEELELALKAAQRAAELCHETDGAILDTLARVYYEQGDLTKAIEWQRKAVEHGQGNPSISKALEKYLSEQPKL